MKTLFIAFYTLWGSFTLAQVGIGYASNYTPTETLEVNGTFQMHPGNEFYLENPGAYTGASGNSLLIVKNLHTDTLNKFDPEIMPFAAVTFVPYHFNNVNAHGLHDYDTKINADKYYVTIGGFFVLTEDGGTSIFVGGSESHFPLYSARAFVQNGTWHLKFDLNNNRQFEHMVDIYLNVSVYYKDFLTKTNTTKVVNMGGNTTGTTPAPDGVIH